MSYEIFMAVHVKIALALKAWLLKDDEKYLPSAATEAWQESGAFIAIISAALSSLSTWACKGIKQIINKTAIRIFIQYNFR